MCHVLSLLEVLTDTTSGPELPPAEFAAWHAAFLPDGWSLPPARSMDPSDGKLAPGDQLLTVNGQKKSFVVKSMISWRGEWYVVHLTSIR